MTTPITSLQKEYIRLLDSSAAAMTIAGADMTPGAFVGVVWRNLTFTGCDFAGDGNVRLASMTDCTFVDCQFLAPNHDFGVMQKVSFSQCRSVGRSVFCGRDGSSGVVFDGCTFSGGGSAPAEFEGIGCTGEVVFRNCTGSGDVLVAGTRLMMESCQFDNMTFAIGRQRSRGAPLAATVVIDHSQGTGVWRMVDGRMKTSHIRNSSFEQIVNDGSECEA
ncbi:MULTISPECIES: hypothetical protein [unclassified Variovorax]|uniref:hypothetical protein n=1 Tax=unclassified Variovorax TaxID=663243 RepID=UPI0008AC9303|nr:MULTISPECIES: hypothetical protein [unclassified Variovorax]SEJ80655.1 hypothetical protein SAMN05518853_103673 [Variovorax sp. OK202]SFC94020.1 hypothetical protein SAMN05444746_103673 [Variovorax sp. OK212]